MKKKLLIIDDDVSFAQTLADFFKMKGFRVNVANDVYGALDIFRREKPKVVLLDFKMPFTTGEQLLPLFQHLNPEVRAIVITGCIGEEVEEKFKGLGYFYFFEKAGLSLEKLGEKVEEALGY